MPLMRLLATFYPDALTIRRVLVDAKIDASRIPFAGASATVMWQEVLTEADNCGRLDALLAVVWQEYGDNLAFQALDRSTNINGDYYKSL